MEAVELTVKLVILYLWLLLCSACPCLYWCSVLELMPTSDAVQRICLCGLALLATAYGVYGFYKTVIGLQSM